jgi:hypothetical protein
MKHIFVFLAFTIFAIAGCRNPKNTENSHDATHTHDDGSVHQNHEDTTHQQQEFKVDADTSKHSHDHDDKNADHKH